MPGGDPRSAGRHLLESQASTSWSDPAGEASATGVLIAAGVAPAAARRHVRAVLEDSGPAGA